MSLLYWRFINNNPSSSSSSSMAETLLSIAQPMEQEVSMVVGVDYLKRVLRSIGAVVADAEKRQVTEESVQVWLEKLKEMSYQIDDVVDEWSTAILKLGIEGQVSASSSSSSDMITFPVGVQHEIALKIKSIKEQLDVIETERIRFNFVTSSRSDQESPQRLISTSEINTAVYVQDEDESAILDHLLGWSGSLRQERENFEGLYIVSIVGAGGTGKTTLAQLAYNHPKVITHFDQRIWVCVSHPFNPTKIFKDILEILHKDSPNPHSVEALQQKVKTCISRNKFLLVLDDVWTEESRLWEQLKNTLICRGVGTRILVTTRKQGVAMMMGTTYMHSLGQLPKESSRELFHKIAFLGKSGEKEKELKEIGEKIADKCKGFPLAIKALGNLMRSKNNKEEWENVLNSEIWKLDVFERDISSVLLWSYYNLPPPIKRCFTFCAVFPKDFVIEVDKLIKLWMAHGYLNLDRSKEMERVGREYFEHLASRSFFQDFKKDDDDGIIMECKMHGIVHDFAQWLTKNECFIMEVDNNSQKERRIDLSLIQKIHHAALVVGEKTHYIDSIYEMKSLRTLLVESAVQYSSIDEALPNLLGCLTCLRALDLGYRKKIKALDLGYRMKIKELPMDVGKLIHLRYLNLSSCADLEYLPETICDLCNLQTLNIIGCEGLRSLPRAMGKLINLRHLQNSSTYNIKDLPKGIGRLEYLQTLNWFIVSGDGDDDDKCQIRELKNLNKLRGSLSINELDEVKYAAEAEEAKLKDKIHLHHLSLEFDFKEGTKGVADALQPHPNLKSLTIDSYGDREWPNWMMMGSSSLTQLRNLRLYNCRAGPSLPPLGQLPNLEELDICSADGVEYIRDEFLGSSLSSTVVFPKLKLLNFGCMSEWSQWEITEQGIIMPCLTHLTISDCQKLEKLPDHLLQRTILPQLKIFAYPMLEIRDQNTWKKIVTKSHIPKVKYKW